MHIDIILNQILILLILVLVGIIGSKTNVITRETNDMLAKFIFNITLPLMLLTNFSRIDVTPKLLSNSLLVILLSVFILIFLHPGRWLCDRLCAPRGEGYNHEGTQRLHEDSQSTTLSNMNKRM